MLKKCLVLLTLLVPNTILAEVLTDSTKKTYTNEDLLWLTKNIYHEARGEGELGMYAVGIVTLNRVNSGKFPGTIKGVVLQKGQFSWVGAKLPVKEHDKWKESKTVAIKLLNNDYLRHKKLDIIRKKRYLYFHNKSLGRYSTSIVIKNHVFYGPNHSS